MLSRGAQWPKHARTEIQKKIEEPQMHRPELSIHKMQARTKSCANRSVPT